MKEIIIFVLAVFMFPQICVYTPQRALSKNDANQNSEHSFWNETIAPSYPEANIAIDSKTIHFPEINMTVKRLSADPIWLYVGTECTPNIEYAEIRFWGRPIWEGMNAENLISESELKESIDHIICYVDITPKVEGVIAVDEIHEDIDQNTLFMSMRGIYSADLNERLRQSESSGDEILTVSFSIIVIVCDHEKIQQNVYDFSFPCSVQPILDHAVLEKSIEFSEYCKIVKSLEIYKTPLDVHLLCSILDLDESISNDFGIVALDEQAKTIGVYNYADIPDIIYLIVYKKDTTLIKHVEPLVREGNVYKEVIDELKQELVHEYKNLLRSIAKKQQRE